MSQEHLPSQPGNPGEDSEAPQGEIGDITGGDDDEIIQEVEGSGSYAKIGDVKVKDGFRLHQKVRRDIKPKDAGNEGAAVSLRAGEYAMEAKAQGRAFNKMRQYYRNYYDLRGASLSLGKEKMGEEPIDRRRLASPLASPSSDPWIYSGNDSFRKAVFEQKKLADKSLFIRDIIEGDSVKLIVRPRDFGKTLNLSMLECFFDYTCEIGDIFQDREIGSVACKQYQRYRGQYVVLYISFKDINPKNFDSIVALFHAAIQEVYEKQLKKYNIKSIPKAAQNMAAIEWTLAQPSIDKISSTQFLIKRLISLLYESCKKQVVLLIDEYDTPLHAILEAAYEQNASLEELEKPTGNYQLTVKFLNSIFYATLKNNTHLFRTVITGVLPIDGIFSKCAAKICGVMTNDQFSVHFGLTADDVREQLTAAFGSAANDGLFAQVVNHYGGYRVGEKTLFNPSSIANFIEENQFHAANGGFIFPHNWIPVEHKVIAYLIKQSGASKAELETLKMKTGINKVIHKHVIISQDNQYAWSYLVYGGYLTISKLVKHDGTFSECELIIPNEEADELYTKLMKCWKDVAVVKPDKDQRPPDIKVMDEKNPRASAPARRMTGTPVTPRLAAVPRTPPPRDNRPGRVGGLRAQPQFLPPERKLSPQSRYKQVQGLLDELEKYNPIKSQELADKLKIIAPPDKPFNPSALVFQHFCKTLEQAIAKEKSRSSMNHIRPP